MSIKDKYKRSNPEPPRKKGNSDIINQLVNEDSVNTSIQEPVNTVKKVKKATFQLDAELHKKLRMFAAENDTTMIEVVEKALNEYLEKP